MTGRTPTELSLQELWHFPSQVASCQTRDLIIFVRALKALSTRSTQSFHDMTVMTMEIKIEGLVDGDGMFFKLRCSGAPCARPSHSDRP